MFTALFVVARIVANPVSNVFQKQLTQRSANPLFIIGATDALLTLAALPLLFLGALPLHLGAGFWPNMIIAAALAEIGRASCRERGLIVTGVQTCALPILFVVARIVANPVSNVFQKQLTQRSANPLFIIGATDALLTLAALPLLFLGALPLHLGAGFWPNMIIAAALA